MAEKSIAPLAPHATIGFNHTYLLQKIPAPCNVCFMHINVDKNPAHIGAVRNLVRENLLPMHCKRRPGQYMNNMVEQDHRFMKRLIRPGLGFGSYPTAWRTIQGYETMHMMRKGQIKGIEKGDIRVQKQFIVGLFGSMT